ncbi:MAG: hypothetical protein FJX45_05515 [Alphaproteobacteria bacterium]|nr:hypothetical protein [Alphaproteobacteria bacterium]MBM3654036.1 hypothetical protein [Alphaproteobacteria bacterium]
MASVPGVIEQLQNTSCAEDFFTLLGVDFDPKLVAPVIAFDGEF